jgi:hypothetical protein
MSTIGTGVLYSYRYEIRYGKWKIYSYVFGYAPLIHRIAVADEVAVVSESGLPRRISMG